MDALRDSCASGDGGSAAPPPTTTIPTCPDDQQHTREEGPVLLNITEEGQQQDRHHPHAHHAPPVDNSTDSTAVAASIQDIDETRRKILHFLELHRRGVHLNESLRKQRQFHNPEILDKIVESIGIDMYGSNYPVEMYDSSAQALHLHEDRYDLLRKQQEAAVIVVTGDGGDPRVERAFGTKQQQQQSSTASTGAGKRSRSSSGSRGEEQERSSRKRSRQRWYSGGRSRGRR